MDVWEVRSYAPISLHGMDINVCNGNIKTKKSTVLQVDSHIQRGNTAASTEVCICDMLCECLHSQSQNQASTIDFLKPFKAT